MADAPYTIGDLAQRLGVTPRTVRYYEDRGLLEPAERSEGGFRLYDDRALLRLDKILTLKNLGLSLEQIHQVLDLFFVEDPDLDNREGLVEQLKGHLAATDRKLQQLRQFREDLIGLILRLEGLLRDRQERLARERLVGGEGGGEEPE